MPEKELIRLIAVDRFLNLTIDKKQELQGIVELAASLYSVPFSVIQLIDHEDIYTNSKSAGKISHDIQKEKLYKQLIKQRKTRIIPGNSTAKHTISINGRKLQFYVAVPLITHDGHYIGSLLLMDYEARLFTKEQKQILGVLASRIVQLLEFDFSLDIVREQFLQVRDAEIKLRSFFESSGTCHLLIGKKMEILAYNKNMAEFIENMHDVKLYPGITFDKILRPQYLDDFIGDYNRALKGIRVTYERQVDYRGTVIWWDVAFEPGYNGEGEIIGISYNATDITERKQHEQRILDQNKSLKTIAHIQSHDLRKPVASILGFMNIFKSENYKATVEELKLMEKAVNSLDDKIRQIVNLSSPEE